jgi:hypothetical protein
LLPLLTEDRCRDFQRAGAQPVPLSRRILLNPVARANSRPPGPRLLLSTRPVFTRTCCSVRRRRCGSIRTRSRIIRARSTRLPMSSSKPSTTATGSTAACRRASSLSRAKDVGLRVSGKNIHGPSTLHRSEIWSFVAEHTKQRLIAGWGLNAARRLPGGASQPGDHSSLRRCPPARWGCAVEPNPAAPFGRLRCACYTAVGCGGARRSAAKGGVR